MPLIPRKNRVLAVLCLSILCSTPLHAQVVTVTPPEIPGPLTNPLMGFRGAANFEVGKPGFTSVVHHYIRWNQIENHKDDSVQKIRDFCDAAWNKYPAQNVKVIPRVHLLYSGHEPSKYWPADLKTDDWSSPEFKQRLTRMITRLGEVWDNDPRVAWVQTGIIGDWGEQESPVGVSQHGLAEVMNDAFAAAFKNKKLTVRNMDQWPTPHYGVYWDSFAHPGQPGMASNIRSANRQGRYLSEVIEGEVAYNWGGADFFGASPSLSLDSAVYTDNVIGFMKDLHCTSLGWISGYSTTGGEGTNPARVIANAARMQKEFGYRFHITGFSCVSRTEPGSNLNIQFKVKNQGSAPFYENWPVAVVLIDEATREIVWKATLPDVDVRTWHPGDAFDPKTRTYQKPARVHQITAAVPLPKSLKKGKYLIGLSILEPMSRTPGVLFAVPNFFKQSQSQPLCRIGIGADSGSHLLTGVSFDDPVADDKRYYTTTAQGPNHTLTAKTSPQGDILQTPGGGNHRQDTGIMVTAKGKPGFAFSSWGGALAGATKNPAILVMDGNKSVSANYVAVPTFTLKTNTSHGSITLNPPGGVYNAGTVVKMTGVPDKGYVFSSWNGKPADSTNSITVTMDSNKAVTAAFVPTSSEGATDFWVNCGGDAHAASDGSVFVADTNTEGSSYSSGASISNTQDSNLYQTERYGNAFGYEIPLANGNYEVTLMFAENYSNATRERVFNVSMEGDQVIKNLDIWSKAGKHAAYNEVHKVSVKDGRLNIDFSAGTGNATVAAIKVRSTPMVEYALQTNVSNGLILLSPPGGIYPRGTIVTMIARPNSGFTFDSWTGDITGTENPKTFTMDGNKSVSVDYSLK